MSKDNTAVSFEDEALNDTLPMVKSHREWGYIDFVWVQSGLAIATWAFLFGGVTALFVGFWDGLWIMLVGNCIGAIPMILASVLITCKWGTEHFIYQRTVYGAIGVMVLVLGLVTITEVGWATILAVMFGRATTQVVNDVAGTNYGPDSSVVIILAFAALFCGWFIVSRGDKGIRTLNRIVAPGLIIMCILLFVMIFTQKTFAEITAALPLDPLEDRASNIMLALELNIAAGVSWWTVAGNIARTAKTQRAAAWGCMTGLVPVAVLAQMVGLTAALVMGDSDPTEWMLPLVGPAIGILLLLFLGLANLTSMASIVYATIQPFIQHLGTRAQKFGWTKMTGIFFIVCAVLVFFTSTKLYDQFFIFVAYTQAVIVSAIGVVISDFYLLRKTRINLAPISHRGSHP